MKTRKVFLPIHASHHADKRIQSVYSRKLLYRCRYVCDQRSRSLMFAYFHMMTWWNGTIFRDSGHLSGEFTGLRWIPPTKASDARFDAFFDPNTPDFFPGNNLISPNTPVFSCLVQLRLFLRNQCIFLLVVACSDGYEILTDITMVWHMLLKRLSKQSCGWWLETPSSSLWRHCNYVSLFFTFQKWPITCWYRVMISSLCFIIALHISCCELRIYE